MLFLFIFVVVILRRLVSTALLSPATIDEVAEPCHTSSGDHRLFERFRIVAHYFVLNIYFKSP